MADVVEGSRFDRVKYVVREQFGYRFRDLEPLRDTQNWGMVSKYCGEQGFDVKQAKGRIAFGLAYPVGTSPCDSHMEAMAKDAAQALWDQGYMPILIAYGSPNDAWPMGTDGMAYSLYSRDCIVGEVERQMGLFGCEGLVYLSNCDKGGAAFGLIMANHYDVPVVGVHGGPAMPGNCPGFGEATIGEVSKVAGMIAAKEVTPDVGLSIVENAIPGTPSQKGGSCGVVATASTMGGLNSLLGGVLMAATRPAIESDGKRTDMEVAIEYLINLHKTGKTARDFLTQEVMDDLSVLLLVLGGSTNGALHNSAAAEMAGLDWSYKRATRIAKERGVHTLVNVAPTGEHSLMEFHAVGGLATLIKYCIQVGYINGDRLHVSGKSLRDTVDGADDIDGDVIRPIDNPVVEGGHIRYFTEGNLGKWGGVFKTKEPMQFTGPAVVCDGEEAFRERWEAGDITEGCFPILKRVGVKDGPGMKEMLSTTGFLAGATAEDGSPFGLKVAIATNGRLSGVSEGILVIHLESAIFDVIQEGDIIEVNGETGYLHVHIPEEELAARVEGYEREIAITNFAELDSWSRDTCSAERGATIFNRDRMPHYATPLSERPQRLDLAA